MEEGFKAVHKVTEETHLKKDNDIMKNITRMKNLPEAYLLP